MTAGEYETLIGRISQDLTTWEAKIKGIDPGKGNPSYDVGTQIDMYKTLGLLEISNAKKMIQQLKVKRTVYAELSLGDSLGEIAFCFFGLESSGVSDLGNQIKKTQDAIELSSVEILLKNDGMERLRLLENSSCAAGFMP